MTTDQLEQEAPSWLIEVGYTHLSGDDIARLNPRTSRWLPAKMPSSRCKTWARWSGRWSPCCVDDFGMRQHKTKG